MKEQCENVSMGQEIKNARLNKKMSQKDLAEKLYVTPQAVSKWENDKSIPDMMTLKNIETLLNIHIIDPYIIGKDIVQESPPKIENSTIEVCENSYLNKNKKIGLYVYLCINWGAILIVSRFFMFQHALEQYVILFLCVLATFSLLNYIIKKFENKKWFFLLVTLSSIILLVITFIQLIV